MCLGSYGFTFFFLKKISGELQKKVFLILTAKPLKSKMHFKNINYT